MNPLATLALTFAREDLLALKVSMSRRHYGRISDTEKRDRDIQVIDRVLGNLDQADAIAGLGVTVTVKSDPDAESKVAQYLAEFSGDDWSELTTFSQALYLRHAAEMIAIMLGLESVSSQANQKVA